MNEKIFSVCCFIVLASCSATGQIRYKNKDCENGIGVNCEIPKTVVTPFEQQRFWYPNSRSVVNHFPRRINQTLNQDIFTGDQQLLSPTGIRTINLNVDSCRPDQFSCSSKKQCLERKRVCDGFVNCFDGSDEINCSCKDRLNRDKICDNYYDCPDGSDEMGCFGCQKDSYTCHSNEAEYIANSMRARCYSKINKCNFVEDCENGKDESDCLLLSPKKGDPKQFVRNNEGYLYRKVQDEWYPVCNDSSNWAKEACEMEQGISDDPIIEYPYFTYYGPYITSKIRRNGQEKFKQVKNCTEHPNSQRNVIMYVKCPDVCGQRFPHENENHQTNRISGGKEAAEGSHPWLVSLHINGTFVCGGSIIDRNWIVTAAHCLLNEQNQNVGMYDYVEIRAGALRQNSFTPHEQTIRVANVSIHSDFDHQTLYNDIALLELEEPLRFNRWVQPICLPTQDSDSPLNWTKKYENITCLTAGWGDYAFRGSSVDNVMEVVLPIVRDCDPANPGVFCAGYEEGGFDTCYGDSGGPLVCQSEEDGTNFFLAGITSYEYNPTKADKEDFRCGEPNSFRAFTRMSIFSPDIEAMKADEHKRPLRENCPGRRCRYNKRCVGALNGKTRYIALRKGETIEATFIIIHICVLPMTIPEPIFVNKFLRYELSMSVIL